MSSIPKFCATCVNNSVIIFAGVGDTPDDAFDDFMANGEFDDQCEEWAAEQGDDVNVEIWSVIDVSSPGWSEEEVNPIWEWALHELIETRVAKAQ